MTDSTASRPLTQSHSDNSNNAVNDFELSLIEMYRKLPQRWKTGVYVMIHTYLQVSAEQEGKKGGAA